MALPMKPLALAIALAASASASASAAIAADAIDLGKVEQAAPTRPLTLTIALPLRDRDAATRYLQDIHTQGRPNYHKFMSPAQFRDRFAPTASAVARISASLQAAGMSVKRLSSALLQVSGPAAAVQKAFGVEVHVFQAQAAASSASERFIAPVKAGNPELDLSEVQAVIGLDSRPRFHSHLRKLPDQLRAMAARSAGPVTSGNEPGKWTVTDMARHYDITPLYSKGIHGEGAVIGIISFASFTPSDAFQYWTQLGLQTDPDRLSIVNVDGGPGLPSDESGSDETTLDVEQSGGVAPGAKIYVYQAPHNDQGFIDAYAQAIESNVADTLSISWGEWEGFGDQTQAVNPVGGRRSNMLQAYHDLFLQAALQGQTLFAATGDTGAYDVNFHTNPLPRYSKMLSVDSPADQPFITAAGGTTAPAKLTIKNKRSGSTQINIPEERAWGWDYLSGTCQGMDPLACGIFPYGAGGGVSAYIARPFYQDWIPHLPNSPTGQQLLDNSQTPPKLIATAPGNFKGRNLPDISLNADPQTGYVLYYTSSHNGFSILSNAGGTSFAAPQLAGIAALLNQSLGSRIGLLNFSIYSLLASGRAYRGFGHHGAPFREVTAGDNWAYQAHRGYNQAAGIGVPDVANLDAALKRYFF